MKKVHGEIEYIHEDGHSIHSDICPPECNFELIDEEYVKFLHECFTSAERYEWINNSNGTGIFYIKAEGWGEEHEFK